MIAPDMSTLPPDPHLLLHAHKAVIETETTSDKPVLTFCGDDPTVMRSAFPPHTVFDDLDDLDDLDASIAQRVIVRSADITRVRSISRNVRFWIFQRARRRHSTCDVTLRTGVIVKTHDVARTNMSRGTLIDAARRFQTPADAIVTMSAVLIDATRDTGAECVVCLEPATTAIAFNCCGDINVSETVCLRCAARVKKLDRCVRCGTSHVRAYDDWSRVCRFDWSVKSLDDTLTTCCSDATVLVTNRDDLRPGWCHIDAWQDASIGTRLVIVTRRLKDLPTKMDAIVRERTMVTHVDVIRIRVHM